jgi:serine/threonine protein kinase
MHTTRAVKITGSSSLVLPTFLADFGIAVILQTTVHRGTSIVGTCNYMAPEAFEVEGIGKHTDVWALACVIVEMITGQRPWARHADAADYDGSLCPAAHTACAAGRPR